VKCSAEGFDRNENKTLALHRPEKKAKINGSRLGLWSLISSPF